MTQIYLAYGRTVKEESKYVSFDVQDKTTLLPIVKMSLDRLNKAISSLGESLGDSDQTPNFGAFGPLPVSRDLDKWPSRGCMTLTKTNAVTTERLEASRALLSKLISFRYQNTEFIDKLHQNRLSPGDFCVLMVEDSPDGEGQLIRLTTVIDGRTCENCDKPFPADWIERHKASWVCPVEGGASKAEKAGFVRIGNNKDANAVRNALNIPSMLVPTQMMVFAPKWVVDGITAFHRNGDSYAGLSLSEFLEKLGGEPTDERTSVVGERGTVLRVPSDDVPF